MAGLVRSRVLVSGRVQGVGFRYRTLMQARALGVGGWVRNLRDGRVEVLVEGTARRHDALCAWLREGPPGAVVERCTVVDEPEPAAPLAEFEIRSSR